MRVMSDCPLGWGKDRYGVASEEEGGFHHQHDKRIRELEAANRELIRGADYGIKRRTAFTVTLIGGLFGIAVTSLIPGIEPFKTEPTLSNVFIALSLPILGMIGVWCIYLAIRSSKGAKK